LITPNSSNEKMAETTAVNQEDIFGPMFAMFFLSSVVGFTVASRRVPFIRAYLKKHRIRDDTEMDNPSSPHYLLKISPPYVYNPSNNLKNLFEFPVLFYSVILYLFVTNQVDIWYIRAAWIYAGLRCMHSFIHCNSNIVIYRFLVFLASVQVLGYMLFRAGWAHFSGRTSLAIWASLG